MRDDGLAYFSGIKFDGCVFHLESLGEFELAHTLRKRFGVISLEIAVVILLSFRLFQNFTMQNHENFQVQHALHAIFIVHVEAIS